MIFNELIIQNFGIYNGRHTVSLNISKSKPIILFGGLNGGGKTTLLDALQLVLYGKFAKCSNRDDQSYSNFLARKKNRYSDKNAIVELSLTFTHQTNTEKNIYQVIRNSTVNNSRKSKEKVEIYCNNVFDKHLSQNWDEYINEFVPLSLSNLFFFDGEKVSQLANTERSSEMVRTGIESLLGIDLINQIRIDLSAKTKQLQVSNIEQTIVNKINNCENEIAIQNTLISDLKIKSAELDSKTIKAQIDINKAQQKVRSSGANLIDERDNIKYELGIIESRIKSINSELIKILSGAIPLNLVKELFLETETQINHEKKIKEARSLNNAVKDYEKKILYTLEQVKASKQTIKQINSTMIKLAEKRDILANKKCFVDFDISIFTGLSDRIELENLQISTLKIELKELKESKALYEKKLETIPDYDTVKHLLIRLTQLEAQQKFVKEENKKTLIELNNANVKLELLATSYTKLLTQQNKDTFEQKRIVQITQHSQKLQSIFHSFGQKLIIENIDKLEIIIKEKFNSLGRKSHLISNLSISPENYNITLYDSQNVSMDPSELSAGERQLLAIAILWGLAEASGKGIPTVIDTPLGRLDSHHRNRLLTEYFPRASTQVILLSTDEEIDLDCYEQLKPFINQEYQIIFDESSKSSNFKAGYF